MIKNSGWTFTGYICPGLSDILFTLDYLVAFISLVGHKRLLFIFNFSLMSSLNKFVIRFVLVILVPVGVFLLVYEIAYRNIPNSYRMKDNFLKHEASGCEILVLGSSHAFFGINPSYFSRSAFNAANVSQDLRHDGFIFQKYLPYLPNLIWVILPVSYFSLFSSLERGGEPWRVRKYEIYMDAGMYPFYKLDYNYEVAHVGDKEVLLYYVLGKDQHDCSPLGFGTSYQLEKRGKDWKNSGSVAAKRHTVTKVRGSVTIENDMKMNVAIINDLIDQCSRKGIQILFVTPPAYRTYVESLDSIQLGRMYQEMRQLMIKKGVRYVDMLRDTSFVEDDFFDADHLNWQGAKKWTLKLDEMINASMSSLY